MNNKLTKLQMEIDKIKQKYQNSRPSFVNWNNKNRNREY